MQGHISLQQPGPSSDRCAALDLLPCWGRKPSNFVGTVSVWTGIQPAAWSSSYEATAGDVRVLHVIQY
jgi:hypothetical protein